MTTIETATGTVELAELGRSVIGERLLVGHTGHEYWETAIEAGAVDKVELHLSDLAAAGLNSVVDITSIDTGRDADVLRVASHLSPVKVVLSTGLAAQGGSLPIAFSQLEVDALADIYVHELTEAIPRTDIRAGVIVLGPIGWCDQAIAERLALAVAFAHAETEAPIVVLGGALAVGQLQRVLERGVDPQKILLSGIDQDRSGFLDLDRIAETGVRMGFTQIADTSALGNDERLALVALALRKYGPSRCCLGTGSWACWLGPGEPQPDLPGPRAFESFVEDLALMGIGAEPIDIALVDAPRMFLSGTPNL